MKTTKHFYGLLAALAATTTFGLLPAMAADTSDTTTSTAPTYIDITINHVAESTGIEMGDGARARYNRKLQGAQYDVEAASLFIFLNKHCFNGLYRVNAKGSFNVPYNGSVRPSYDTANLEALSRFLKGVTIGCMDFEEAVLRAISGDFIFFDSPYAPLTASSFEKYTKNGFPMADHLRLARLFRTLSDRGCLLMLTNHDTPLVRELYQGFSIESLPVKRLINRDAAHRTGREVLITNY